MSVTTSTRVLRLATRGSLLARTQSSTVGARLTELTGRPVELVEVRTQGDVSNEPLETIGGTGVFAVAVREAVRSGAADIAVHSLKDLPTAVDPDLTVAAVPRREDPRDALCGSTLADLPEGARVGTGSPRRAVFLRQLRPDLQIVGIRGNVDTRLSMIGRTCEAVVLAYAGLLRVDRAADVAELFDADRMTPAPGQGALAVECRADAQDDELWAALRDLDDPATRACVTAERALLATLEAGCTAPVGALGTVAEEGFWEPELTLRAAVAAPGGDTVIRLTTTGAAIGAQDIGRELAEALLAAGAADLLGSQRS